MQRWCIPGNVRDENLNTKYPYVVHAELNAILNASRPVKGCRIYVSMFPCNECAKAIVQSGINEIIFLSDKYFDAESCRASKKMFESAGIKYTKMQPKVDVINLNYIV